MRLNLVTPTKYAWCVASGRLIVLAGFLALAACSGRTFTAGELPATAQQGNPMLAVPLGSG